MGGMLLTDKLVFRWLEVLGVWSLDSATPATIAYPAHASGASEHQDSWVDIAGESRLRWAYPPNETQASRGTHLS